MGKSALPAKIKAADEFSTDLLSYLFGNFIPEASRRGIILDRQSKCVRYYHSVSSKASSCLWSVCICHVSTLIGTQINHGNGPPNQLPNPSANVGGPLGNFAAMIQAAQAATIAALELHMRVLDTKSAQLSTNSASLTIKFGGVDNQIWRSRILQPQRHHAAHTGPDVYFILRVLC